MCVYNLCIIHIYICVYTYMCVCVYIYIYIYIYTQSPYQRAWEIVDLQRMPVTFLPLQCFPYVALTPLYSMSNMIWLQEYNQG